MVERQSMLFIVLLFSSMVNSSTTTGNDDRLATVAAADCLCIHGHCDVQQNDTRCICDAGFVGLICDRCLARHFGAECQACECSEISYCVDGLEGDGSCLCQDGFTGPRCDERKATVMTVSMIAGFSGLLIGLTVGTAITGGLCVWWRRKKRRWKYRKVRDVWADDDDSGGRKAEQTPLK
jgi:hypothetical protein